MNVIALLWNLFDKPALVDRPSARIFLFLLNFDLHFSFYFFKSCFILLFFSLGGGGVSWNISWEQTFEKRLPPSSNYPITQPDETESFQFCVILALIALRICETLRICKTRHEKGGRNPSNLFKISQKIDIFCSLIWYFIWIFAIPNPPVSSYNIVIFFDWPAPPSFFLLVQPVSQSNCLYLIPCISLHRPFRSISKAPHPKKVSRSIVWALTLMFYASVLSKNPFVFKHLMNFGYSCLLQSIMLWYFFF